MIAEYNCGFLKTVFDSLEELEGVCCGEVSDIFFTFSTRLAAKIQILNSLDSLRKLDDSAVRLGFDRLSESRDFGELTLSL
jgi:hypothetical protein